MDSLTTNELIAFLQRMNKSVKGAAKNSRRLTRLSDYNQIKEFLYDETDAYHIHLYGSRIIGVAHRFKSDLDIFIEMKPSAFNGMSRQSAVAMVKRLKSIINADEDWHLKIALYDCTVPILRCYYISERLDCKSSIQFS